MHRDAWLLLFHIEIGSPYIVLAGLKRAVQTRLVMNSQGFVCLCLLGAGIKGVSSMALMPGFVQVLSDHAMD